jgi:hypothetical protein
MKFTGSNKGRLPENDDAFFIFFQERHKTAINSIALFLWHEEWLSFFKHPALDSKSNMHVMLIQM